MEQTYIVNLLDFITRTTIEKGNQVLKLSRKLKIITVALILASIPIVVFSSHFIQLTLMEHVSLKEFIVRMIAANQNLNVSSPMYGSFYNSSWPTMQAIDVLNALGGFSSIDDDAVLQFLIGPSQTGPVDQPMKSNPEYNEWQAFLIVHTASVLGRLEELPGSLIEQITETIRVNQNSTIETPDWRADRAFLFETARLLNETRYINFTLQKQDIIDWIEPVWILSREIGGIFLDVKALEEISIMERGWAMADLPEMTRNFLLFYILSLWDDAHYGFYKNFGEYYPKYYEPTLETTSYAVRAYEKVFGTSRRPFQTPYSTEHKPFMRKVGNSYEKLLAFLKTRQNRYGIFFDKTSDVDDKVTSLQLWPAYNAVSILQTIDRLDFLNQTVRWPAQPTFVESLGDRFG